MNSQDKNDQSKALEDFKKIKAELGKASERQRGIIAETFNKKDLSEVEFSPDNYDALKRIHAYEQRKQQYFARWLKTQQAQHAKREEDFEAGIIPGEDSEGHSSVFLILTVDLVGAKPWALAKIEQALSVIGFEKYPTSRMKAQGGQSFNAFGSSARIYATEIQVVDNDSIDADRDRANDMIRKIMENERNSGSIEEFRYILFSSEQWSWRAGGISG